MNDTRLSDEQWTVIQPFPPPRPTLGRRRRQDPEVLNSLTYRLKTGCRYRDIPRVEEYAVPSTTHHWVSRWVKNGVFNTLWQQLLALLNAEGMLHLSEGSLDGRLMPAKEAFSRAYHAVAAANK